MFLSASLTIKRDGCRSDEKLGSLDYTKGEADGLLGINSEVAIPGSTPVTVASSYVIETGNLSFAVLHGGNQQLLAMVQWNAVTPYFGVRLPGLGVLQIYFRREASSPN